MGFLVSGTQKGLILEKASYAMSNEYLQQEGKPWLTSRLPKREITILALLLAVSLLVRVLLFPLKGYSIDTNDFISWFGTAAAHGIRPFYSVVGFADYPPFNVYIFWFFGSLANAYRHWHSKYR